MGAQAHRKPFSRAYQLIIFSIPDQKQYQLARDTGSCAPRVLPIYLKLRLELTRLKVA
jgi:hypothetical protein